MTLLRKFTRTTEVSWTTLVDLLEPETYAEKVKSPPSTPSKSPVWFGSGVKPGSNQKEKTPATALAIGPLTPKAKKNSAPQQVLRKKEETPMPFCTWCRRNGHQYADCWRRLGLCFGCGSDRHFVSDCPRRSRSPSASPQPVGTGAVRRMSGVGPRFSSHTPPRIRQTRHSDSQDSRGPRNLKPSYSSSSSDDHRAKKKAKKKKMKKHQRKSSVKSGSGTSGN